MLAYPAQTANWLLYTLRRGEEQREERMEEEVGGHDGQRQRERERGEDRGASWDRGEMG